VNRRTEFERIRGGFRGLHRGLRVEVDARKTDRGRIAKQVEKHRP
jgi:cold shock CspA family protein